MLTIVAQSICVYSLQVCMHGDELFIHIHVSIFYSGMTFIYYLLV